MIARPSVIVHLAAADVPAERLDALAAIAVRSDLADAQTLFMCGPGPSRAGPVVARAGRPMTGPPRQVPSRRLHSPLAWQIVRSICIGRALQELGPPTDHPVTILHAWSLAAASWCVRLHAGHRPVLIEVQPGDDLRRVAAWSQNRSFGVVCPTAGIRQALTDLGVPPARIALIRPLVTTGSPSPIGRAEPEHRASIRRRLGLADTETAVLALPPVTRRGGGICAAWATFLLEKVRADVRLIVPADGREVERVRRLADACDHNHVVRMAPADLSLRDLLGAADLAIHLPSRAAPITGLAAAMAAGCPLVAAKVPPVLELLASPSPTEGRRYEACPAAWLCAPNDPKDAARVMLVALSSMEQTKKQVEQARRRAQQLFSRSQALALYERVYANLATRRPAAADGQFPVSAAADSQL